MHILYIDTADGMHAFIQCGWHLQDDWKVILGFQAAIFAVAFVLVNNPGTRSSTSKHLSAPNWEAASSELPLKSVHSVQCQGKQPPRKVQNGGIRSLRWFVNAFLHPFKILTRLFRAEVLLQSYRMCTSCMHWCHCLDGDRVCQSTFHCIWFDRRFSKLKVKV